MILHKLNPFIRGAEIHETRGVTPAYVNTEYVFTYLKNGSAIFLLENVKYSARSGDMILMPPYMFHIINTDNNTPMTEYVVLFDLFFNPRRMGPRAKEEGMTFRRYISDKDNPENLFSAVTHVISSDPPERKVIENAFLEIKREFEAKKEFHELVEKACMLEILSVYLRRAAKGGGSDKKTMPKVWMNMERAINFIHANHSRQIGLEEISREARLSLNYFCQLFQKYTNSSAHKYLNSVRVEEAKKLIRQGEFNFSQIAEKVGFTSIHLFSRIFKRIEGVAPSEWTRHLENGPGS